MASTGVPGYGHDPRGYGGGRTGYPAEPRGSHVAGTEFWEGPGRPENARQIIQGRAEAADVVTPGEAEAPRPPGPRAALPAGHSSDADADTRKSERSAGALAGDANAASQSDGRAPTRDPDAAGSPERSAPSLAGPGAAIHDGDDQVGPDDDTAPLPVVLQAASRLGRDGAASPSGQPTRVRGPFEPAGPPPRPPASDVWTPAPRQAADFSGPGTSQSSSEARADPAQKPQAGTAKLDQIKDLYITAEAIGDDALAKHFEQVSERQRQLIREYFNQSVASRQDADRR